MVDTSRNMTPLSFFSIFNQVFCIFPILIRIKFDVVLNENFNFFLFNFWMYTWIVCFALSLIKIASVPLCRLYLDTQASFQSFYLF